MHSFYTNKNVLVTGGCGFIGSHLVEALVHAGARVTILDNLSTGYEENIASVASAVTLIHDSITNFETCRTACENQDIIFHLAAFISVPDSITHPRLCHETNTIGTLNMLEAARLANVSRFVFSSSAAVYGTKEGLCSETDICAPESPYGLSKQMGELFCTEYASLYNIGTISLRYFNVYGARQNPNGPYAAAVAAFTRCMQTHTPITIYGDGTQTRDFVPATRVVNTNMLVGSLPMNRMTGDRYNVATGSSITLLSLIKDLKAAYPAYDIPISFAPARAGDVRDSRADIRKLSLLKELR